MCAITLVTYQYYREQRIEEFCEDAQFLAIKSNLNNNKKLFKNKTENLIFFQQITYPKVQ